MSRLYKTESYVDVLKMLARELVDKLKEKIDVVRSGDKVSYDTAGIELLGSDTNESVSISKTKSNIIKYF